VLAAQNQPLGGASPEKTPDKNAKPATSRCREANLSILAELRILILYSRYFYVTVRRFSPCQIFIILTV
jgi:hypothetical protein